jgi:hypothetical protein
VESKKNSQRIPPLSVSQNVLNNSLSTGCLKEFALSECLKEIPPVEGVLNNSSSTGCLNEFPLSVCLIEIFQYRVSQRIPPVSVSQRNSPVLGILDNSSSTGCLK